MLKLPLCFIYYSGVIKKGAKVDSKKEEIKPV